MFALFVRPRGSGNFRRCRKEGIGRIQIQYLGTLIVFKNAVPASPGTTATGNLSTFFNGFRAASLARTTVPTPIDTRFGTTRIVNDLEQTLASLVFSHKAACNKFHKDGKVFTKPWSLFSKEGRFRNATGIHTTKRNAGGLVVFRVQKVGQHHETQLRIFVGLGPIETVTVGHFNGFVKAGLESIQIVQIGNGIDATATDGIVVTGDTTHHGDTRIVRTFHAGH
mmetsp:Transcript_7602/g.11612  ORF Transcript_7602/g.11612 Transcript_7602/m.11612 type:complete len:224 (+) Transcript_7602:194-865(+)